MWSCLCCVIFSLFVCCRACLCLCRGCTVDEIKLMRTKMVNYFMVNAMEMLLRVCSLSVLVIKAYALVFSFCWTSTVLSFSSSLHQIYRLFPRGLFSSTAWTGNLSRLMMKKKNKCEIKRIWSKKKKRPYGPGVGDEYWKHPQGIQWHIQWCMDWKKAKKNSWWNGVNCVQERERVKDDTRPEIKRDLVSDKW